jgi:ATP/maltotriose-dependent transcriptional regulator MalT
LRRSSHCDDIAARARSIYQKLGVPSRTEAIERAVDLRLL